MEQSDFLGRGWKFPVSIKGKQIQSAAGKDSIAESILIILGTTKGERVMRPDFGCSIHELVFAPNSTTTATLVSQYVKEALSEWEPRIRVVNVSAQPDEKESGRLNINIQYELKTTNVRNNLVYPFYLEGKR